MKKTIIILILCFAVLPLCLYANDRFRMPDRTFEIGLMNTSIGFSNNFLSVKDIFQETAEINLDNLDKGLKMYFDASVTPFYFTYNRNNEWGFGPSTGLDATGIINLSGNMLSLGEAKSNKSDIGFALFADTQLSAFFHVSDFRIKVKPAVYYPLVYVDSDISYTFNDRSSELDINYDLRVFTAWSMQRVEDEDEFKLDARPGVDISLGVEYPLAEMIGLREKYHFLDFSVGLDLINIPVYPSQMKHYSFASGKIGGEGALDIFDEDNDMEDFYSSEESEYLTGNKTVLRPFTLHAWADWHPFGKMPISFIPTLGFQVNPLFDQPYSLEAGIKTRFNLKNIFITTLGLGYHDRTWKNSIDLIFNMRFFEFNLGFDMRSPDFLQSWQGTGFGLNFGLKFGW